MLIFNQRSCCAESSFSGHAAAKQDASLARVAVFYSISSTQKGLAGIDLGNFLIKQARPSCMPTLLAGPWVLCGST